VLGAGACCHAAEVRTLADLLVVIVAGLHVGFLVLEMVLWTRPEGRKVFGTDRAFAEQTRALAANQGLYNGFLAAGLVWGLLDSGHRVPVLTFFLVCVIVAGGFGALTVNRRILLVQAVPAAAALVAVLLAG
jgi:putative membrane protein